MAPTTMRGAERAAALQREDDRYEDAKATAEAADRAEQAAAKEAVPDAALALNAASCALRDFDRQHLQSVPRALEAVQAAARDRDEAAFEAFKSAVWRALPQGPTDGLDVGALSEAARMWAWSDSAFIEAIVVTFEGDAPAGMQVSRKDPHAVREERRDLVEAWQIAKAAHTAATTAMWAAAEDPNRHLNHVVTVHRENVRAIEGGQW